MTSAMLFVSVALTVAGASAQARPIDVDCNRGETIGAALARLEAGRHGRSAHHLIRIRGACNESVLVEGLEQVTLRGTGGATLTTPDSAPDSAAVKLVDSREIAVEDLTIDAGAAFAGVLVRRCQGCAVRRTAVSHGTVSIYVEQPGFTEISELDASGPASGGVWVADNAVVRLWEATLEGPGGGWLGVWVFRNAGLTMVATTVRGFFGGIGADGSASLLGAGLPQASGDRAIRIQDNTFTGAWISGRAQLQLGASDVPVVISDNGFAGIFVLDSSASLTGDVQIASHQFAGLSANQNATVTLSGVRISDSGTNVSATLMSLVDVVGPVTLAGGSTDVGCDAFSLVNGRAGISGADPARIQCPNFQ